MFSTYLSLTKLYGFFPENFCYLLNIFSANIIQTVSNYVQNKIRKTISHYLWPRHRSEDLRISQERKQCINHMKKNNTEPRKTNSFLEKEEKRDRSREGSKEKPMQPQSKAMTNVDNRETIDQLMSSLCAPDRVNVFCFTCDTCHVSLCNQRGRQILD